MGRGRQRGTGVRVRSEAKAAAADRLLLAAQEQAALYDLRKAEYDLIPKWRWRKRQQKRALLYIAAARHMHAIRAAQDVAKKGKYVDV